MNRKTTISLIIMAMICGPLWTMPVPSQGTDQPIPKVCAGGGTDWLPVSIGLVGVWASFRLMYLGSRNFINDETGDDFIGAGEVLIGTGALVISSIVIGLGCYDW